MAEHPGTDEPKNWTPQRLEACLERARATAREVIRSEGDLPGLYLAFHLLDGRCCAAGIEWPHSEQARDQVARLIRHVADRIAAHALVVASSAWMLRADPSCAPASPHIRPSEAPEREEVLVVSACCRDGHKLLRVDGIRRSVDGVEFDAAPSHTQAAGRLADLLDPEPPGPLRLKMRRLADRVVHNLRAELAHLSARRALH